MACNCTKCSTKCGCSDTALTNPCTYTDCSVGSERCDDIQCAECVSYCGTSFQIGATNSQIVINSGERLDSIIQKFSMMIANGLGACTSDDVLWDGIWSSSTGFNIYIDTQIAPGGWVLQNSALIATTISNYTITNLSAGTAYKVKVQDAGIGSSCQPIEILFSTLAL